MHLLGVIARIGFREVENEIGATFGESEQGLRAAVENVIRRLMTELLQGFEDLFAVVLYRLLLAFLLPLALARCRNFFLHFSRFFFPQVVQHGDFQLRSSHAASNRSDGSCRHASGMNELSTDQVIH